MLDETLTQNLPVTDEEKPLPESWRLVRIGDVCELNPTRSSLADKLKDRKDETPTSFVQMSAVDERLGIIARPEAKPFGQVKKGYTIFAEGDVLFAKITPCMQNGKHAIATDLINGFGFGSTEFHVLRPTEKIISGLIHYFLRQPSVLKAAMASFTGTVGQQRVPETFLANLKIPLPPTIVEQRRIASILDEQMKGVEEARRAVEEQLEAANLLPNAFLRSIFESEEALNWQKRKLGELCEIVRGSSPRPQGDKRFYGGNVPRLMVADLTRDGMFVTPKIDFLTEEGAKHSRPMKKGEVVIAVSGNPGLPAILAVDACIHDGFVGLRYLDTERVNTNYLYHLLFTSKAAQSANATGAIFRNLTTDQVRVIEIPLPPTIEKQEKVVEKLNEQMQAAESLKKPLTEKLEAINKLPAALLRKAFAGGI